MTLRDHDGERNGNRDGDDKRRQRTILGCRSRPTCHDSNTVQYHFRLLPETGAHSGTSDICKVITIRSHRNHVTMDQPHLPDRHYICISCPCFPGTSPHKIQAFVRQHVYALCIHTWHRFPASNTSAKPSPSLSSSRLTSCCGTSLGTLDFYGSSLPAHGLEV